MAKNKYKNYTKEQLIAKLKHLERHRYGLVWEDRPEEIADKCANELPVLVEDKNKEIISDTEKPTNFIFEGDNYHTLYTLNFTHKKKIDAIYIDPPYNTGATDWKYNNNFVDKNDRFRHSKWLSFMNKRLRLARNLLKDDGIICVTIDDYELPRLFILMEKIFGEKNHLGTIVIRNNPAGRSTVKGISITHEYALFFGKKTESKVGRLERTEKQKNRYNENDKNGNFEWVNFRKPGSLKSESPKMFYPIFASTSSFRLPKLKWNSESAEYEIKDNPKKDEKIIYPIDDEGKERRWRWGIERFRDNSTEFKTKKVKNKLHIYFKGRTNAKGILPMTWWENKLYSSTAYGTNLLKTMFSELQIFSYPKSIYAVQDCIKVLTNKKDSMILDFFAGSGTTGHAVLELNKEDGGNRQFILCTNNENGICEEVTYPRIKKVIEGYADKEGIPANVKYFKTDFVPNVLTDKDKRTLVSKSTELLCIAENTFEVVSKKKRKLDFAIFKNSNQFTVIIYDENCIEKCCMELNKIKELKKTVIYVFSYDHTYEEEDFKELKTEFIVKPIPEAIINVYRKISKLKNK